MDEKELQALYNAVNSKFDIGAYDQFKSKMQTPDQRKNFYNVVSEKGFDLGDINDYEKRIGGKKKISSVAVGDTVSIGAEDFSGGGSNSTTPQTNEIPTIEMLDVGEEKIPTDNVLKIVDAASKLRSKKKQISTGSSSMGVPTYTEVQDDDAVKQADAADKFIESKGYNPKKLKSDFKDIPEWAMQYQGFTKPELLKEYKDNPAKYERLVSNVKSQANIHDNIFKQVEEGNFTPEEANNIWGGIRSSYDNMREGDFSQQRENVRNVISSIDKYYTGDNKEEIKNEASKSFAERYGKEAGDVADMATNPLFQKLNSHQLAYYSYLQDTHPQEARKYQAALLDDSEIKDNPEAILQKQEAGRALDAGGIELDKSYNSEQLAPIKKRYEELINKENLTDSEKEEISKLEEVGSPYFESLQQADEDQKNLVANYPKAARLDAMNFVQDLVGQKHSGLDFLAIEAGNATDKTAKGIWDIVSEPFRSEQNRNIHQAEILGNDLLSQNSAYLPQSKSINQTFKPTLSKELQEDIDYIKNDKDLTTQQKITQATDLLMNRSGEWQRTPESKTNLGVTSLMYGVGSLAANIAPFIASEMLTGGGATPSAVRKFTSLFTSAVATTFHDEYVSKLKEGSANPFKDATVSTAINAAALTGADTPALIKKWAMGQKSAIGSLISKLTDKEIEAALSETPKALSKFKRGIDGAKNVIQGTASAAADAFKGGAKVSAFTTGGQIANDALNGDLKAPADYLKQAAIETLKFTILGTAMGTYGKVKSKPSEIALSMADEVAKNPAAFKSSLSIMESDGAITPTEAAQVRNNIDKIEQVYKSSPILKNDALTDEAKREYLYNSLVKQESKDASNGLPPQQKEKLDYQAQVADFKNNLIVSPPTDKQLATRKEQLEKSLTPETKEDGTKIEINEKLKRDTEAELEAVNHAIQERESVSVADKNAKKLLRTTEDATTIADANAKRLLEQRKGTETTEPIQENIGETNEGVKETVPESIEGTGQGESTTAAPVLEKDKIFEQDGDKWTHLTDSKELVDKLINGEDFIGKGEKLENFVKGVKNDRFNLSHENGTAPYFQKGKFYGKDPTQKYLIVAKGDDKFTPNVNHQNAESIEKSSGVGVLNPEFRNASHFEVYERMPDGNYKKISKESIADKAKSERIGLIDKAKEIVGTDVVKGFTSEILKDAAKENPKEFEQHLNDIADQANDPLSNATTVKTYGKELVDIAQELFPPKIKDESKSEITNTPKEEGVTDTEIPKDIPPTEAGEGAKETIVSHAGMQELADDFGLGDVTVRDPVSDAKDKETASETATKWNKEGTYAKNIEGLLKNIEDGHGSNPVEKRILQDHIANVRAEAAKMDIHDPKYDAKIAELERLKTAGAKLKSTAGATLRTSTLGSVENPTMADWMAERQEVKGEPLTDKQKDETAAMFKEYEEKVKAAEDKQAQAEKEVADLKAELALKPERERAKTIRKKNREALTKERKDLVTNIRDKWKNAGKDILSSDIPYRKQLAVIAPDVMKLVRNLAETGTSKLTDVVDVIYEDLKDVIKSKKDVTDIIAGEYNEKKKPLSELQKTLKDLKEEARLINKVEAVEEAVKNGVRMPEKEKTQRNEEITKLREQIDELQKQLPKKEITDDSKLSSIKKRNEKSTKDIEDKINRKDFETKKTTPFDENSSLKKANPQLWNEVQDSRIALQEAKDKLEYAKRQDQLSKSNFTAVAEAWKNKEKLKFAKLLGSNLLKVGGKLLNTFKAIKAGIDDSVTFVQLGLAVMANPTSGAKAKWSAIKDTNAKSFRRNLAALHNSPYWNVIEGSKLDITEPKSLSKENLEETYSGNLLDNKIGKLGIGNLWTYSGGIFERLFTSMGNNLRLNLFMKRIEALEAEGKNFADNPDEYRAAARVINELTGRGKVDPAFTGKMSEVTSALIWAPKMLSSSLNILGGEFLNPRMYRSDHKGYYRSLTPAQRTYAITQLGKGVGVGVSVMTALAAAGWKVNYNPQSTGFGAVTTPDGNTSYNVFGRFSSTARFVTQMVTGKSETMDGKEIDLDLKGRGKTGIKFLRGKMTPAGGLLYDYTLNGKRNSFTQKKIKFNPKSIYENLIEPISSSDLKKGLANDGTISLLTRFLPAIEGIQVQDKRDFVEDLPTLIDKHASSDNQEKEKIVNNKEKGRPITDDEFEKYNTTRNKKITDDITKMYNSGYPLKRGTQVKTIPYKEMTKDEIIDATTDIKKNATNEAKEELFGKHKKTIYERRADRTLRKLKKNY